MVSNALYDLLGVSTQASDTQIRRAYRNLLTKAHPDKGGDAKVFQRIQQAYEVLSDASKRKLYDSSGRVEKGVDEAFAESFGNGNFRDVGVVNDKADGGGAGMAELIVTQAAGAPQSHTAGFEAWMRSRGAVGASVFNAETVAEQYGVVKSSYEAVPLSGDVFMVECRGPGQPTEVLSLIVAPLPAELEWGQVLVHMKYAPISPADVYSARLGGVYGQESTEAPFVAGHDGVGVVARAGPGVRALREGDVVLPLTRSFAGTWATARAWRERDLLRLGAVDGAAAASGGGGAGGAASGAEGAAAPLALPLELCALSRELLCAYRLLEARTDLKPGDCVILNAANSTVGQLLLQLAKLLRLRAVAVVRPAGATAGATAGGTPITIKAPGTPPTTKVAAAATVAEGGGGGNGSAGAAAGDGAFDVVVAVEGDSASVEAAEWDGTVKWLKSLGASEVLQDTGSIKLELERLKFFARPKLALDAVGGDSGLRIADALGEGGSVVVYGCASGKSPSWPWSSWVFKGLQVSGFNVRRWMTSAGSAAILTRLAALGKLVDAGLLRCNYTEYDISEFAEALEHALESRRNTKVLLRMTGNAVTPAAAPKSTPARAAAEK